MPDTPRQPNERLLRTLIRKHLDLMLDLLEALDFATGLEPGVAIEVANANQTFHLQLLITRLNQEHPLRFGSRDPAAPPAPTSPHGNASPALKRIHRMLLAQASLTEPAPAKALISRAGYKDNSYSWDAITYLARQRLLVRTPDGYVRAS
jgi:hypothetical protein